MISSLLVKRGYFILASSLDEWRTQAYENAKLFKEKDKIWHDKRIQKREFKVGEYVLLYISHFRFFAGKLLSKWEVPYVIEEIGLEPTK